MARMPRATVMSMLRAPASFLTNCSESLKRWHGRRLSLNWHREARAKACGSISRLACAACGDEDQISNVAPRGRRARKSPLRFYRIETGRRAATTKMVAGSRIGPDLASAANAALRRHYD